MATPTGYRVGGGSPDCALAFPNVSARAVSGSFCSFRGRRRAFLSLLKHKKQRCVSVRGGNLWNGYWNADDKSVVFFPVNVFLRREITIIKIVISDTFSMLVCHTTL